MNTRLQMLSGTEALILDLLRRSDMYGLQLVSASRGRLKRGTVYVTLGRMEEKGYVQSRQEDPHPGAIGLPRRLYEATALGLRLLDLYTMVKERLALEGAR